jgi:Ser/Thr protein kinase RdoA (MazF antagonist)
VALNEPNGGRTLWAGACDADSRFTIPGVPAGTWELVVFDEPLDVIIASASVTVGASDGVVDLVEVPVFSWFARYEGRIFYDEDENGWPLDATGALKPPMAEVPVDIRFRDGSIYQASATSVDGTFEFTELFPFFNWMVGEVDYARFKATGATVVVDAGGPVPADSGYGGVPSFGRLNPQAQLQLDPATGRATGPADVNPNSGNNLSRTEVGTVLLEGIQAFLGQTVHVAFGKKAYAFGENGGIAGIVHYAITRAEVDPRTAAATTVLAQHRATVRLHRLGLPVPPPVRSPHGGTLLQLDGCCYALYPWIDGRHRHGTELTHGQCEALGALLARVHAELDRMKPPVPQPAALPCADPARTDRLIRDLLEQARGRSRTRTRNSPELPSEQSDFDRLAVEHLALRRELLAAHAHRRPPAGRAPRTGWVHGDFHPLNLLYRGDEPAAIVDWDRLGVQPRAEEAVRAAAIFFLDPADGRLDLRKVRAYARAYRRAAGATRHEVAAAVHRVWWERLNDFWMLHWHYGRADRRSDPLFPAASALAVWWTEEFTAVREAFTR